MNRGTARSANWGKTLLNKQYDWGGRGKWKGGGGMNRIKAEVGSIYFHLEMVASDAKTKLTLPLAVSP